MKYVELRLIPALKERFPGAFKKKPDYCVSIQFDNAPYHCGTTTNVDGKDKKKWRFDPRGMARKPLAEVMLKLGLTRELEIKHTVVKKDKTSKEETTEVIVLKTTMKEEAVEGRRGKQGVVSRQDEFQEACWDWLVDNHPSVLDNDLEAALKAAGNIEVCWGAPNFPNGAPIEMVWAAAKQYARIVFPGKRNLDELADHVHDGLYTGKVAHEAGGWKGGNFVAGADGKCPAAEKLFKHVWESPATGGGFQEVVRSNPTYLKGTIDNLVVHDLDLKGIAEKYRNRAELRHLVKRYLSSEELEDGALEHMDDEEEDEEDDADSDDE